MEMIAEKDGGGQKEFATVKEVARATGLSPDLVREIGKREGTKGIWSGNRFYFWVPALPELFGEIAENREVFTCGG